MALGLGSLTGDTLAEVATYLSLNANSIAAAGDEFIQGLAEAKDYTFDVGDLDVLNYLNLTNDPNLFVTAAIPDLGLAEINNKIDQLTAITAPTEPTLNEVDVTIPNLDAVAPDINLPDRPDPGIGLVLPTDAPVVEDTQPPTAPDIVLPDVPTFEDYQIPSMPSISLPSYQGTVPVNQLTAPTMVFDYVDPGYTSDLKDPLVAKLLDALTNGGYGIEPNDEQALWARARDRAEQEGRIAIEQAGKDAVSTSSPMPQGAYFARLEKAREEVRKAISNINREIALRRSELYVENRKFTIQEVQKYEQIAISLYNAVQERALNFAKASVELGIMVYDAAIKKFNADLEAYRAEAQVFEIQIRAELNKIELFKAQIQAESLRGEFNQTKVNLYNAQILGVGQVVNLYKSRLEAVGALTKLQELKLDSFKTRVSTFAEAVRAKQIEFDLYRTGISGELVKSDIYKTQIEAYQVRVGAEEKKAKITLEKNQALLQQFDAAVKTYESQLTGFSKAVDARLDRARTQVSAYSADIQSFSALAQAVNTSTGLRIANQKANSEWNIAALNSRVEAAKFRLEQLRLTVDNMNQINRFGAEYFRTALGTTLSGLNGISVKSV